MKKILKREEFVETLKNYILEKTEFIHRELAVKCFVEDLNGNKDEIIFAPFDKYNNGVEFKTISSKEYIKQYEKHTKLAEFKDRKFKDGLFIFGKDNDKKYLLINTPTKFSDNKKRIIYEVNDESEIINDKVNDFKELRKPSVYYIDDKNINLLLNLELRAIEAMDLESIQNPKIFETELELDNYINNLDGIFGIDYFTNECYSLLTLTKSYAIQYTNLLQPFEFYTFKSKYNFTLGDIKFIHGEEFHKKLKEMPDNGILYKNNSLSIILSCGSHENLRYSIIEYDFNTNKLNEFSCLDLIENLKLSYSKHQELEIIEMVKKYHEEFIKNKPSITDALFPLSILTLSKSLNKLQKDLEIKNNIKIEEKIIENNILEEEKISNYIEKTL